MPSIKTNEKYTWILNTTQFKADSKDILNVQVHKIKLGRWTGNPARRCWSSF